MPQPFMASGRQPRLWFAVVVFSLTLSALLIPGVLEAQAPLAASTSVSLDERGAAVAVTAGPAGAAYHPSRVLVRFRKGAPSDFIPGSLSARVFPGDRQLYLVHNAPGLAVAEAVRRYKENPNVLYAEPDYVVQVSDTIPNDPRWSGQWDMVKIAAPTAWDTQTDSADVVVAIIDTGIDYTHPDLLANLWVNPADSSHGFTCMNGTCIVGGFDDYGHGTHVAGTIGAVGNNATGIAGINWKV